MRNEGGRASFAVDNLTVDFHINGERIRVLKGIDVEFPAGGITGIIGESGSGKSVLGQAMFGILPANAVATGCIKFNGIDMLAHDSGLRSESYWGRTWGLIPQMLVSALNPVRQIYKQINDARNGAKLALLTQYEAEKLLSGFGFDEPARVLSAYPHELSGGMLQRVLCAIVAACKPAWILADEPTKGLDPDTRDMVEDNLRLLHELTHSTIILITHDILLAEALCERMLIMYAGRLIEASGDVWTNPLHPYSKAFFKALPQNGFCPLPNKNKTHKNVNGCSFSSRCPEAMPKCFEHIPPTRQLSDNKMVRCFLYD